MFQPLVKPKPTHDGTKQCPLQVDTFHEYAEAAEVPEEAAPRWGTAEWATMAKEEEDQQEVVNIAAWEAWARDEPQYDAVEVEDPAADGGAPAAGDGDDRDDAADDADGSWHTAADDTPAGAAAAAPVAPAAPDAPAEPSDDGAAIPPWRGGATDAGNGKNRGKWGKWKGRGRGNKGKGKGKGKAYRGTRGGRGRNEKGKGMGKKRCRDDADDDQPDGAASPSAHLFII